MTGMKDTADAADIMTGKKGYRGITIPLSAIWRAIRKILKRRTSCAQS